MPIGPLMIDIATTLLSKEDEKLLQNPQVGGLILFNRNFENLDQLRRLIYQVRNCRKDPILIAVDQEGGRVQRFHDKFTSLPSNRVLGELYEQNPDEAIEYAYMLGWLMASELLSVGVDMSFAPVLDIDTGFSEVIKGRGFHSNPDIITELGIAYIHGMQEAGMAATGKHFPGHGSVQEDSHHTIPIDTRDLKTIAANDTVPFEQLALLLDAVMTAHVIYENIDTLPAGFSQIWLQEFLRAQFAFQGAIFSDDLTMKGANVMGDFPSRAHAALSAGCDMILICNNRPEVAEVLHSLKNYSEMRSQQRLLKLCGHFSMTHNELIETTRWKEARYIAMKLNEPRNGKENNYD